MGILELIMPLLANIIDKVLPGDTEATKNAKIQLEQRKLEIAGAIQSSLIQADALQSQANSNEAASTNLFISGWRPAVGWLGVIGLMYSVGFQPLISYLLVICHLPSLPMLDGTVLTNLLYALLGLGGLRTYEKMNGVSDSRPFQPTPPADNSGD